MADLWRDFWIRETGTGQQVAQLHNRYMMMMIFCLYMTVCCPVDNRQSYRDRIVSTNCCIHRLYLLMKGLDTPETCRGWGNILRISCVSSWFFFTRLYPDARSTKHKISYYGLPCLTARCCHFITDNVSFTTKFQHSDISNEWKFMTILCLVQCYLEVYVIHWLWN